MSVTGGGRWRAEEVGREIVAGYRAIEHKPPERVSPITFVDLQVAVFASKLHRMPAQHLRKSIGCRIGSVGLVRVQCGYAEGEAEVAKRNLRHILLIGGRRSGNNAESVAIIETQGGKRREAAGRGVLEDVRAEDDHAPLVHRRSSEVL